MISILYVDDDYNLLELSKAFLENGGDFEVTTAISAKEGLKLLREGKYDSIISDYQMPEMDGIHFLKEVRRKFSDVPFILFTGKGREEVVIEALNHGADFYLQKGGNPKAQFVELAHKVKLAVHRRQMEWALQRKTEELDNFFSLSLDLLCIADLEGRFIRVNQAWEGVLGISVEELERSLFLDFVHPEDRIATNNAILELEAGKKVINFINRFRTKEGNYRWIEWRAAPFKERLIYAAASDITERKQSEDQIRDAYDEIAANEEELRAQFDELMQNQLKLRLANEQLKKQEDVLKAHLAEITAVHKDLETSEKNFRSLVDNAPEMIYIANDKMQFIYVNKAGIRMLGAKHADQLLGTRTLDRIHPSFHPIILDRITNLVVKLNPVETLEEIYLTLDGDPIEVEVNAVPIIYQGENEILVIARDISKRKRAEEALLRSEQMLKLVIDHFPAVIFWKDRNLIYLGGNKESAKVAGFADTSEFLGKSDYDMPWGKTQAEAYRADDRQVMEEGQAKLHVIERQLRANGELGWLDTSKVPLRDSEGNVVGMMGISMDITEQKQIEEALRKANLVVERSPVILFRWKAEEGWPVDLVSNNVSQFGYGAKDFLSGAVQYANIVHPEDLDFVTREVEHCTGHGIDHFNQIYRILTKEGKVHWVDDRTTVERDKEGHVQYLQGTVLDITDRMLVENALKKMNAEMQVVNDTLSKKEMDLRSNLSKLSLKEKELEASEDRYRRLLEQSYDAIIKHRDGKIIFANEAAIKLIGGRTKDDLLGRSVVEFGDPASSHVIKERVKHLYDRTGTVVPLMEEKFRRLDGTVIDVEVLATSYMEEMQPTVQVAFRDVTDTKRMQNELKESEEKYHELFELGGEAIFLVENDTGKILECNTAATELYGYDHEELLRLSNLDLSAEVVATQNVTKESPDGSISIPLRYHKRKDGTVFPVEINGRFFAFKGKKVHVAAIRDITERKRIEDALRQTNKKLNLLNSITRHDIVNKIAVLRGSLEIARRKSSDATMAYIERVDNLTQGIMEHIEFSRIYQDLGLFEPIWQSVPDILDGLDIPTGFKFEVSMPKLEIFSDPMLIKVFYNLLDNCLRHGVGSTKVTVSAIESDEGIDIIWEDNGIGIPDSEKEKIFEHGYGKNTGLGLFISREILAITEIKIKETGKMGEGARFEIFVPKGGYRIQRTD
jgi:PAS domain S-box-containing protein